MHFSLYCFKYCCGLQIENLDEVTFTEDMMTSWHSMPQVNVEDVANVATDVV
jgi:hypothetical protein